MSTPEFVKMKKIQIKPKNIKLGTTNIWVHVRYNLKNMIVIFEVSTLEFFKFQCFVQKKKF